MRGRDACVVLLVVLAGCGAPLAGAPAAPHAGEGATDVRADPATDRLGWEAGYWYDDPVAANNSDGLTETERAATVARAMARVERIRGLEFTDPVDVTVVSRSNFSAGGGERDASLERFDNAKFEALLLVGEGEDSVTAQSDSRNRTVGGYYSPRRDAIVVVSDADRPTLDGERTLAHELVHALQDQQLDVGGERPRTRDAHNARNGLVEGDASVVERAYLDRCGSNWSCLARPGGNSSGGGEGSSPPHMGIYLLSVFPYTEGEAFVSALREEGGWDSVNAAYADPPGTTREVISPADYGSFDAREVAMPEAATGGWDRVRPPDRPDHAVLGQSALATAFAYTIYDDYNRSSVVALDEFLNMVNGSLDEADPLNYDLAPTRGWTGDRLHVYEQGEETGYVWRLTWESAAAAGRFADGYRALLSHWDGTRVATNTWRASTGSPFTDSYYLDVEGEVVTVVNAPTEAGLAALYPGAR